MSTHHGDGTPLRKSDKMDGVALQLARRQEARYPELSGSHRRARLVVITGEVGGRWSRESGFLAISGTLQGSGCTSHPLGERRGGVVQEVVQLLACSGPKRLQSHCWRGGATPVRLASCLSSGGVGRRAA